MIGCDEMLFEKRYNYYLVKFDDEKKYWYRSGILGYQVGKKVIVPISNNGKWKIGLVAERHKFKSSEVPYPINKTKGIVQNAGLFSDGKVSHHNNLIEKSKYPPYDISVATVNTKQGPVRYITCRQERNLIKSDILSKRKDIIIIETYPAASFDEIPSEAQAILREKQRKIQEVQRRINEEERQRKERELLDSIEFEEEMEDLDQYN